MFDPDRITSSEERIIEDNAGRESSRDTRTDTRTAAIKQKAEEEERIRKKKADEDARMERVLRKKCRR